MNFLKDKITIVFNKHVEDFVKTDADFTVFLKDSDETIKCDYLIAVDLDKDGKIKLVFEEEKTEAVV